MRVFESRRLSTTPGADDNASAVAVLLEVSRMLKLHSGKRTVRYVAFACEEPPYFNLDADQDMIVIAGCFLHFGMWPGGPFSVAA